MVKSNMCEPWTKCCSLICAESKPNFALSNCTLVHQKYCALMRSPLWLKLFYIKTRSRFLTTRYSANHHLKWKDKKTRFWRHQYAWKGLKMRNSVEAGRVDSPFWRLSGRHFCVVFGLLGFFSCWIFLLPLLIRKCHFGWLRTQQFLFLPIPELRQTS